MTSGGDQQLPKRRSREGSAIGVLELPQESRRVHVKCADCAVAEISDQQRASERSELCGSNCRAQGSVERASRCDPVEEVPLKIKHAHKPGAGGGHRIVP